MKWSISNIGSYFIIELKRIIAIISERARIVGKEIAKQLRILSHKQNVISDSHARGLDKERSIGFKQLLRRLGIITAAKLGETVQETRHAIKHEIEVGKQDIGSELVPLENTIKRSNLNEDLAEKIRQQVGLDCEASKIGSLEIEHKRYYSNSISMSPQITTNRGCILVKDRAFSVIQVIQRN
jgi:hypothetical protein